MKKGIIFFVIAGFLFTLAAVCFAQCADSDRPASASTWEEGAGNPDNIATEGIDDQDENVPARVAEGDEGNGVYD